MHGALSARNAVLNSCHHHGPMRKCIQHTTVNTWGCWKRSTWLLQDLWGVNFSAHSPSTNGLRVGTCWLSWHYLQVASFSRLKKPQVFPIIAVHTSFKQFLAYEHTGSRRKCDKVSNLILFRMYWSQWGACLLSLHQLAAYHMQVSKNPWAISS